MIGGALARPCISYPELFPRGTIWDRYPYLLPNLFSAATVFVGVIIGLLFLEETHAMKKSQRDRGRELGDRIATIFSGATTCKGRNPEKQTLLDHDHLSNYRATENSRAGSLNSGDDDEALPAYQSTESSPRLSPQADTESRPVSPAQCQSPAKAVKPKIFTKPVIMNIISYGILAL